MKSFKEYINESTESVAKELKKLSNKEGLFNKHYNFADFLYNTGSLADWAKSISYFRDLYDDDGIKEIIKMNNITDEDEEENNYKFYEFVLNHWKEVLTIAENPTKYYK